MLPTAKSAPMFTLCISGTSVDAWIWAAVVAICFKLFGLGRWLDLSAVAVGDSLFSFFHSIFVDSVAHYHSGAADGGGGGYSTPHFRKPGGAHPPLFAAIIFYNRKLTFGTICRNTFYQPRKKEN